MKKIILTIFILQCSSLIAEAQWISQYPNTPGIAFRDIEFINRNTGWACGEGIIVKTTNSGANWVVQSQPATNKSLYSIHPVDSMTLYCVGWFETILKTTNGGTNWIALRNGPSGSGRSYEGVFFINENIGWVCGQVWTYYNILKTTNGGQSWDSTYLFWGYLKDFFFINSNTGLLSASFGGIFKTTNGGSDWEQKAIPHIGGGIGDFRKLSVIDDQYVFVVEDVGRVYKSSNFGNTWDSIGFVGEADQPYACRFSSLSTGWVGGTFGELFKSTDGGATWNWQNTNGDVRFIRAFWFHNDSVGWAVGGNTKIFHTTSSGLTFINNVNSNVPDNFKLYQNYPNPFNSSTVISYKLAVSSFVSLKLYDLLGKEVITLIDQKQDAGYYNYQLSIDNFQLSSGVYFYTLFAENYKQTRRMILLK